MTDEVRATVEPLPPATGECWLTPKKIPIGGRRAPESPREPWLDEDRVYIEGLGSHVARGGSEVGGGQYTRRSPTFLRRKRVRG